MKSYQLGLLAAMLLSGAVLARTEDHQVDINQPTPPAKIIQHVTTTTTEYQVGEVLPAKAAQWGMSLGQTMKLMGLNLKKLSTATTTAEMDEPAQELAKWASQAEALGVTDIDGTPATAEQQDYFTKHIHTFREMIAGLQQDIAQENLAAAKKQLGAMSTFFKGAHEALGVGK